MLGAMSSIRFFFVISPPSEEGNKICVEIFCCTGGREDSVRAVWRWTRVEPRQGPPRPPRPPGRWCGTPGRPGCRTSTAPWWDRTPPSGSSRWSCWLAGRPWRGSCRRSRTRWTDCDCWASRTPQTALTWDDITTVSQCHPGGRGGDLFYTRKRNWPKIPKISPKFRKC